MPFHRRIRAYSGYPALLPVLLRQKEGLPELAGLLVRMSRDPWTDDVWRDYCVQFLGKCYPAVADMDSRRSMADALWEALETRRASSCAGAAGRQLMSLSRSFREFPPGDVSRAALEALRAPECSDGSRCALLQVCAVLGDTAALPDARAAIARLRAEADTHS